MDSMKFERIAGEGETALYNLYIDCERVGEALTMDEVMGMIAGAYEPVKPVAVESLGIPELKNVGCRHEWMYVADKDDSVLYQCIKCRRLKTVRFGDVTSLDPAIRLPTERAVEL